MYKLLFCSSSCFPQNSKYQWITLPWSILITYVNNCELLSALLASHFYVSIANATTWRTFHPSSHIGLQNSNWGLRNTSLDVNNKNTNLSSSIHISKSQGSNCTSSTTISPSQNLKYSWCSILVVFSAWGRQLGKGWIVRGTPIWRLPYWYNGFF